MQDNDMELFILKEKNKLLNERLEEVYKEFYELKDKYDFLLKNNIDIDGKDTLQWFQAYLEEQSKNDELNKEKQELLSENQLLKDSNTNLKNTNVQLEQIVEDLSVKLVKNELKESIQKYNPIDFDDVWMAVLNRLKSGNDLKKDFDGIVSDIKKYNPSLFFKYPI